MFLIRYYGIVYKYGFLLPAIEFIHPIKGVDRVISYVDQISDIKGMGKWLKLPSMYYSKFHNAHLYPTLLYYKNEDDALTSDVIVDVRKKKSINDVIGNYFEEVLNINTYITENDATLSVTVDSNVFIDRIWEWKEDRFVDNSALSYLNSPRFNSFLRDFKNICSEFGSTKFSYYPHLEERSHNEYGFLIKNEIVYYEDLYDLLPEEHKYKPFEEGREK